MGRLDSFDRAIRTKLGDSTNPPPTYLDMDAENCKPEEEYNITDADDFPEYDTYINSEVIPPKGGDCFQSTKVVRQATKSDGSAICLFNNNPILYTMIYEIVFNYGSIQEYATNQISLSMYDHINEDGYMTRLINSIERHRSDDSTIKTPDGYFKDSRG